MNPEVHTEKTIHSETLTAVSDTTTGTKRKGVERFNGLLTWMVRLLTGGVFLYSGFVKAVDPWGSLYKFNEYLAAMGINVWPNLVLAGVFILFTAEFLIGVFLLSGSFRRTTPLACLAFMCVMLPLTLWVAVSDPVSDCGCFGDALIISNWATFWKNVVLSVCGVWLLKNNRRCRCLVTPALQWIACVATSLYIIIIGLIGFEYQPLIDFRPYQVGTVLFDISDDGFSSEPSYRFIYEKDGVKHEFGEDDELPDEADGWIYVSRREIKASTDSDALGSTEKNLRVWDEKGEEDLTDDLIEESEGKDLYLLMPALSNVSIASSYKINSLYTWANKNDIRVSAIVAGSSAEIDSWRDLSMAEYPIYTADDTAIKEVARGNPAVIYVENDTIVWKSTLKTLQTDDFLAPDITTDPRSFKRADNVTLYNITMIWIAIIMVLIVTSLLPYLKRTYLPVIFKSSHHKDR
ncbi:MAG: DoxX family protein [Bacteroidales bacterium]|nr:DoxX family protein [Bacteroidales bacterium]